MTTVNRMLMLYMYVYMLNQGGVYVRTSFLKVTHSLVL